MPIINFNNRQDLGLRFFYKNVKLEFKKMLLHSNKYINSLIFTRKALKNVLNFYFTKFRKFLTRSKFLPLRSCMFVLIKKMDFFLLSQNPTEKRSMISLEYAFPVIQIHYTHPFCYFQWKGEKKIDF